MSEEMWQFLYSIYSGGPVLSNRFTKLHSSASTQQTTSINTSFNKNCNQKQQHSILAATTQQPTKSIYSSSSLSPATDSLPNGLLPSLQETRL
jgi:putative AlgH/UPF0301 family transcriptional regulator